MGPYSKVHGMASHVTCNSDINGDLCILRPSEMDHPKAKQSVNKAHSFFLCLWKFPTVGLHHTVWSCTYLDLVGDHCTIRYAMFHSSSRKWNFCQWSRPSHVYWSHILPPIHGTAPNMAYGWLYHAICISTIIKPHMTLSVYVTPDPPREGLTTCKDES